MLRIGERCHIGPYSILSGIGGLEIGDEVTVSAGGRIYSLSHHYRSFARPEDRTVGFGSMLPDDRQAMVIGPVVIGRNTGLAADCLVLPGVTIGEDSFLLPRSLVRTDIEPGVIAGGDPGGHRGTPLRDLAVRENGRAGHSRRMRRWPARRIHQEAATLTRRDALAALALLARPAGEASIERYIAGWSARLGGPCEGVASGRGAIVRALEASGIGRGDDVIVTGWTCVAVPAAVMAVGARPRYADVDATGNVSAESVMATVGPTTRAVIVQHTLGNPAPTARIRAELPEDVWIVEDLAHAVGSSLDGQPVGRDGDWAIVSTEQSKVLHTGQGGILAAISARARDRPGRPARPDVSRRRAQRWLLRTGLERLAWSLRIGDHDLAAQIADRALLRLGLARISSADDQESDGGVPPWRVADLDASLAQLGLRQLSRLDEDHRPPAVGRRHLRVRPGGPGGRPGAATLRRSGLASVRRPRGRRRGGHPGAAPPGLGRGGALVQPSRVSAGPARGAWVRRRLLPERRTPRPPGPEPADPPARHPGPRHPPGWRRAARCRSGPGVTDDSRALPGSTRTFLAARGLALVAAVIGAVLAARLLGPEARGSLGIFVFSVTFGAAALGIGLPTALYDVVRRDRGRAPSAVRGGRAIAVAAGLVGGSILLAIGLAGWTVGAFDDVDPRLVALAAAIGIAGMLSTQAHTMAHVALGAMRRAAIAQAVPSLFVALGYIAGLWVFGAGLGGAILGFAIGQLASAVVTGVGAGDVAGATPEPVVPTVRLLLRRGTRVELSDVANVLSYRVDILLLAALGGLSALGRYSVGVQLLEPLWVMGSALAMSIMATAARPDGGEALHASVATAVRISVLVCVAGGLLACVAVALLGPYVLGPGFETVPLVMVILVPGIGSDRREQGPGGSRHRARRDRDRECRGDRDGGVEYRAQPHPGAAVRRVRGRTVELGRLRAVDGPVAPGMARARRGPASRRPDPRPGDVPLLIRSIHRTATR